MSRNILFPIGRLVGGSVHVPRPVTDDAGKPVLDDAGVAKTRINFGYAIPKQGEPDWRATPWGQEIIAEAQAGAPNYCNLPSFSYKVIDGDSTTPNEAGTVPNSNAGYPGCWVIWFSQTWVPKLVNADGSIEIPGEKFIPGYFIRVYGNVSYNGGVPPKRTPGVYQNPAAVALIAEGEVIELATSVDTTVFATSPTTLPANAKPIASAAPEFGTAGTVVAPPPVVVQPNTAILSPPPADPVTTAKANGATYAQLIGNGWSHEQLIQHGMIVV